MTTVLVCGGRDYDDRERLWAVLDELHANKPITRLIHGGARGADTLGHRWAYSRRVPISAYNAEWAKYGKSAGHIRNARMLKEGKPDYVVACPGGRGTADMVRKARVACVPIVFVEKQDEQDEIAGSGDNGHGADVEPAVDAT